MRQVKTDTVTTKALIEAVGADPAHVREGSVKVELHGDRAVVLWEGIAVLMPDDLLRIVGIESIGAT